MEATFCLGCGALLLSFRLQKKTFITFVLLIKRGKAMNRYGKSVLLLLASLTLVAGAVYGQSRKVKGGSGSSKSTKGSVTDVQGMRRSFDYDSIVQVLNEATRQLQEAVDGMAKRMEKQNAGLSNRLQQYFEYEDSLGAWISQESNHSVISISPDARSKTTVRENRRTVNIGSDSVWVEYSERQNGKMVKRKSVFPRQGKRIRIVGDSLFFDDPSGRGGSVIALPTSNDARHNESRSSRRGAPEEHWARLAKQLAAGADSIIDSFYRMDMELNGNDDYREALQQVKRDIRAAFEGVMQKAKVETKREGRRGQ